MWNLFKKQKDRQDEYKVVSPVNGVLVALENVNDPAFASKSIGDGFAVAFKGTSVVAPCDGTIAAVFPTGHAIGIQNEFTEVIVHIGIDTVTLQGDGFHTLVQQGDTVKKGEVLVEVSSSYLEEKGFDPTTMVIFTDGKACHLLQGKETVKEGEEVASIA